MRARDLPKLHHPDPSGFWNLVRTGEKLPVIDQQILFVYDIRGTADELRYNLLHSIAKGDPYRLTNGNESLNSLPPGVAALNAELFKLPTTPAGPKTLEGYVNEVGFDEVLQEHWISIKTKDNVWSPCYNPDCIVYWAPFPTAPNTFTPRDEDEYDLYRTDKLRFREQDIRDRLESRAINRRPKHTALKWPDPCSPY